MASNTYSTTKETVNYARLSRLLVDICANVLREILEKRIPLVQFSQQIINLKFQLFNFLNAKQKQALYPASGCFTGTYNDFDISLLYVILRSICLITPPTNKWGMVPDPLDRSLASNIERIHIARNSLGHSTVASISDNLFKSTWDDLDLAVKELENNCLSGQTFQNAIPSLLIEPMDLNTIAFYIDKIKDFDNKVSVTNQRMEKLEGDLQNVNKKVLTIQVEISTTDKKVISVEADVQKENKRTQQMEKKVTKLEFDLENTNQNVNKLEVDLEHMNRNVTTFQGGLEKSNQTVNRLEFDLEHANQNVKKLEVGLDNANQNANKLEHGLENTNKNVNKLEFDLEQTNRNVDILENGVTNTTQNLNEFEGGLESTNQIVNTLKSGLENTNQNVCRLKRGLQNTNRKTIPFIVDWQNTKRKVKIFKHTTSQKINQLVFHAMSIRHEMRQMKHSLPAVTTEGGERTKIKAKRGEISEELMYPSPCKKRKRKLEEPVSVKQRDNRVESDVQNSNEGKDVGTQTTCRLEDGTETTIYTSVENLICRFGRLEIQNTELKTSFDKFLVHDADKTEKTRTAQQHSSSAYKQRRNKNSNRVYEMESYPRGLIVIINNKIFVRPHEERTGTDKDCFELEKLYLILGFRVEVLQDLTSENMVQEMLKISQYQMLQDMSCIVIALLSHGNCNETILGVDGTSVRLPDLWKFFTPQHCPALTNKPKMFIVNACRGGEEDRGYYIYQGSTSVQNGHGYDSRINDLKLNVNTESNVVRTGLCRDAAVTVMQSFNFEPPIERGPIMKDFLIAYSSFPGHISWRDSSTGSLFIQALCDVFKNEADKTSVMDMLTTVNDVVASHDDSCAMQVPAPTSTLTKIWLLNPPPRK